MARMILRVLSGAVIVWAIGGYRPLHAGQDLPILSGRWSNADCARSSAMTTRYFGAGSTASANDQCRVTVRSQSGNVFHAHLDCRYPQASDDQDDIVIAVRSPGALDWINQCMAVSYHFCAQGIPDHGGSVPQR